MKNLRILLVLAFIVTVSSACHFRRHSTIRETGDGYYLKIEYSGWIHFSVNGSAINSISRGGYLKYERNEQKLEVHNDGHGCLSYKMSDNGDPITTQNQQEFIARAVRYMLQKNHHLDWN